MTTACFAPSFGAKVRTNSGAVIPCEFLADEEALDLSVLGRDISNVFCLIVDRPRDLVCLLGAGHQYSITPAL